MPTALFILALGTAGFLVGELDFESWATLYDFVDKNLILLLMLDYFESYEVLRMPKGRL